MPIESPFTHITDLNASNPLVGDDVGEGDDHIRGLKTVLLTDFPNINAAVGCTPAELNFNDGATSGTLVASKTVVAGSSKEIDLDSGALTNVNIDSGTMDGVTLGTTNAGNTESTGNNSTKLATTAYVKQEIDAQSIGLTLTAGAGGAAEQAFNTTGQTASAHGFGALPDLVTCFLECTTNDGNYSVGDQIAFGGWKTTDSPAFGDPPAGGISAYSDTTNVYACVDEAGIGAFYVPDADGTTNVALDEDDWKVVVKAYKIA